MEASVATQLDRSGTGDLTLVLLHGWGLERTSWDLLRRHLDPHVRTVAYDMWGFGENVGTGDSPDDATLSRYVSELLEVCEQLEGERIVLVGASRGGTVALKAAAEHPKRFEAVVTIGAPARGSASDDYPIGADAATLETVSRQLEADYSATFIAALPMFWLSDDPASADLDEAQQRFVASLSRTARPDIAVRVLRESLSDDIRDLLPRVEVPTLALGMERDAAVSPEAAKLIAGRIPAGRFHLISGAGHVPHMTMPSLVAGTILGFLREVNLLESGNG